MWKKTCLNHRIHSTGGVERASNLYFSFVFRKSCMMERECVVLLPTEETADLSWGDGRRNEPGAGWMRQQPIAGLVSFLSSSSSLFAQASTGSVVSFWKSNQSSSNAARRKLLLDHAHLQSKNNNAKARSSFGSSHARAGWPLLYSQRQCSKIRIRACACLDSWALLCRPQRRCSSSSGLA
jgi:hypothetical protein